MSAEVKRKFIFDNREAMAYLLFCRFNTTRDEALAAIDEVAELFPAVAKLAEKKWRSRRRADPRDGRQGKERP